MNNAWDIDRYNIEDLNDYEQWLYNCIYIIYGFKTPTFELTKNRTYYSKRRFINMNAPMGFLSIDDKNGECPQYLEGLSFPFSMTVSNKETNKVCDLLDLYVSRSKHPGLNADIDYKSELIVGTVRSQHVRISGEFYIFLDDFPKFQQRIHKVRNYFKIINKKSNNKELNEYIVDKNSRFNSN